MPYEISFALKQNIIQYILFIQCAETRILQQKFDKL